MRARSTLLIAGAVALLLTTAVLGGAEEEKAKEKYDLLYVPTPEPLVTRMLQIANVSEDDVVYDLGCGDGRVVVTAAMRYGAEGIGVDLDPERIKESRRNAKRADVTDRVTFRQQDLFDTYVGDANVVFLYLLPELMEDLREKLLRELKPGTIVLSNDFGFGEWKPDRSMRYGGVQNPGAGLTDDDDPTEGNAPLFDLDEAMAKGDRLEKSLKTMSHQHRVLYWIVPAAVEGTWRWHTIDHDERRQVIAKLDQRFQTLDGSVRIGDGAKLPVEQGRISGRDVHFEVRREGPDGPTRLRFQGTVDSGTLTGSVRHIEPDGIDQERWEASRTSAENHAPWK